MLRDGSGMYLLAVSEEATGRCDTQRRGSDTQQGPRQGREPSLTPVGPLVGRARVMSWPDGHWQQRRCEKEGRMEEGGGLIHPGGVQRETFD